MELTLRDLSPPDIEVPSHQPNIPAETYRSRCRELYDSTDCDWVFVYGDREHFANLMHLIGFDPRFEEAFLLLGPDERKVLVVGVEGEIYADLLTVPDLELELYPTLGLMGQDRSQAPRLDSILESIGLKQGQRIGIVGWKYMEEQEHMQGVPGYFVPSVLIETLKKVVDGAQHLEDVTSVLMHPTEGLRMNIGADQIATFEWAAARASAAVIRVLANTEPGMTELEAASNMGYAGEPFSCHVIFASGDENIVGLRSPRDRSIERGDGIVNAIGMWGGLCCRAGLVAEQNEAFVNQVAKPYYRGIVTWYETVSIGTEGGTVYDEVASVLQEGGLEPLLNPGHLLSYEEWPHTPIQRGSSLPLKSGMALQCDIIPTPLPEGQNVNCEDTVVLADEGLREDLRNQHPDVWDRVIKRRTFMKEELGINIDEAILPLSTAPAYLPPLWMSPRRVFTKP